MPGGLEEGSTEHLPKASSVLASSCHIMSIELSGWPHVHCRRDSLRFLAFLAEERFPPGDQVKSDKQVRET